MSQSESDQSSQSAVDSPLPRNDSATSLVLANLERVEDAWHEPNATGVIVQLNSEATPYKHGGLFLNLWALQHLVGWQGVISNGGIGNGAIAALEWSLGLVLILFDG